MSVAVFFFSSRRRHTRSLCDWSSDVCSSDLGQFAEKLLPNIRKLTDAARRDEVFLVSHGCFHPADDPEFQQFPPHCLKGMPGAEFVPEALTNNFARVENRQTDELPADLSKYQQIVLEKQTLDIF